MRTKTQREVRIIGPTFSNNGQKREEKIINLKATKYKSELKEALAQFLADLRKENGKDCLDNFALFVISR